MRFSKHCERCGQSFQVPESRKDSARYCSNDCRLAAFARGSSVELTCDNCGATFSRKSSQAAVSTGSFCSSACYWATGALGRTPTFMDTPRLPGVPRHARVLSRDGWLSPMDLAPGRELLGYSFERDCLEWTSCTDVLCHDEPAECMRLSNSRHDLVFGLGSEVIVRRNTSTVRGRKYGGEILPIAASELNTNHSLLVAAPLRETRSVLTPDQAALLGWIVTDGYFRRRGGGVEAVIYQSPKKYLDTVIAVAGGKPRAPHPDTGVVCVPVLRERIKPLEPWLSKEEELVGCVARLSTRASESMYDAMYLADGSVAPGRKGDYLAVKHPGVRSAFRVLALFRGYRTSESSRGCYVSQRRTLKLASCDIDAAVTDGLWQPVTEMGTCVVRCGQFITLMGAVAPVRPTKAST